VKLPWVSRTELDAALEREKRLAWIVEANGRETERYVGTLAAEAGELKEEIVRLRTELAASYIKQELLLDRIVQLSGQPALYAKPPEVPPAEHSDQAGPKTRASFDDVREAARKAIADGTFGVTGRPN
jgi:hypothetical protein